MNQGHFDSGLGGVALERDLRPRLRQRQQQLRPQFLKRAL
jgi:glutamate racemase